MNRLKCPILVLFVIGSTACTIPHGVDKPVPSADTRRSRGDEFLDWYHTGEHYVPWESGTARTPDILGGEVGHRIISEADSIVVHALRRAGFPGDDANKSLVRIGKGVRLEKGSVPGYRNSDPAHAFHVGIRSRASSRGMRYGQGGRLGVTD